jgi:hypothetical protein
LNIYKNKFFSEFGSINYGYSYPQLHDIDINPQPDDIVVDLDFVLDMESKYPLRLANDIINGVTPSYGSQNYLDFDTSQSGKKFKSDEILVEDNEDELLSQLPPQLLSNNNSKSTSNNVSTPAINSANIKKQPMRGKGK